MRTNLINARKTAGKTQREVAGTLNIHIRYYQKLEAGASVGRRELWDELEILFDIPQRQLLQND